MSHRFVTLASIPSKTHLGKEIKLREGMILNTNKNGRLVIPAHTVTKGKGKVLNVAQMTLWHCPVDLEKYLAPVKE
jgi:hypothetical protein